MKRTTRFLDLVIGISLILLGLNHMINPKFTWDLVAGIVFLITGIVGSIIAIIKPQLLHKPILKFRK
jgi:hypothetical protein